jgi:hypothetical protein
VEVFNAEGEQDWDAENTVRASVTAPPGSAHGSAGVRSGRASMSSRPRQFCHDVIRTCNRLAVRLVSE